MNALQTMRLNGNTITPKITTTRQDMYFYPGFLQKINICAGDAFYTIKILLKILNNCLKRTMPGGDPGSVIDSSMPEVFAFFKEHTKPA